MEPHRSLPVGIEEFKPSLDAGPEVYFKKALVFTKKFYGAEFDKIASIKFNDITPEFFFQEYLWVVHATGFSAKAVENFMPELLRAYGSWDECGKEHFVMVMTRVAQVCNNPAKAKAIHATAKKMCSEVKDWSQWRDLNLSDVDKIQKLPYIGKITRYHLGRNIGLLECVKPDLHLVRMAEYWNFPDCESMCRAMRADADIPLGLVDLALWYTASTFGTIGIRKDGQR